jgi:hypothetical protein
VDQPIIEIAQQLQSRLERLDPQTDRDTLIWAHGFLTGLVNGIRARVPEFTTLSHRLTSVKEDLHEAKRILQELDSRSAHRLTDDPDSLERIERELEDPGDAPVPARPKPGPKGLSGGAAAPLPESDLTM